MSFAIKLPGNTEDFRKIDIYNWAVKFIRSFIQEGNIRLASLEDIAAFKLDAITHRKEKKDYVDIAESLKFLFSRLTFLLTTMESLFTELRIARALRPFREF